MPPNEPATYRDLLFFEERLKTNAASLQRRKARYQLFLLHLVLAILFLLFEVVFGHALHPYVASGLLFVAITTLLLFFASGMYSEKIAYANRYVPHANKALRSFNMHLNVRRPPSATWSLALLFPRPAPATRPRGASPLDRGSSVAIAPIPPAANPRGELIFSSRVDRAFRESYERYRAAFERKREERAQSTSSYVSKR